MNVRVASALAFKNAPPGCCAATAGVSECHPPSAQAWTAADATEKPSLQRQSPEQAATDSSALRQEPTEDPPQWTTPRARHNAQTGIVTCSRELCQAGRPLDSGGRFESQRPSGRCFLPRGGRGCGILRWGWRRRRNHILPLEEDVVSPDQVGIRKGLGVLIA